MRRIPLFVLFLAALSALAAPLSAATLYGGIDPWTTPGDGTTFQNFSRAPLPSGFFCNGSAPFTGKVVFRGYPIATDVPGALGSTDTIIERLDDATFDARGRAVTRLQARSLNLESVAPIRTSCGSFNVRANLVGPQPVTRMKIFLEKSSGGRYIAPLSLNVKLTFTPVNGGRALSIVRPVRFSDSVNRWSSTPELKRVQSARYLRVDTDGDGRPDTLVPGTSNFTAGGKAFTDLSSDQFYREFTECHDADGTGHLHCPGGTYIY